ncbi:MAG: divergent polysaccharide deacetylase family protein [Deltaproteobacteria bacterium]|jgi:polysaccharide deacetylase 2 family uncharacterized protein YibQ|nr:divergent polysaccharide deacetylase family protein [Deltaproteobacteria bacterium]
MAQPPYPPSKPPARPGRAGGRKDRKKDPFPFLAAFLAGLLLAAAGLIGFSYIFFAQRQNPAVSFSVPQILPGIAPVPEKRDLHPLTQAQESAVAGALADLRELPPKALAPSSPPDKARAAMVIVIDDLGENLSSIKLLLSLDYPVTFSFWPHGARVREGTQAVHEAGGEILIHYPMEPLGYPGVFPGPGTLLSSMPAGRIAELVEAGISAVPHAVGLNNHMGSRFTQNRSGVAAVLLTLKQHDLFVLDSFTHKNSVLAAMGRRLGLKTFSRDVFLDDVPRREAILAELRQAERLALRRGKSIAIGHPLPETLAVLKEWQATRNPAVRLVRLGDLP